MKKLCTTCVVFLFFFYFSTFTNSNCFAAETEGVTGVSYLTYIDHPPYFDILAFNSDGTFDMTLRGPGKEGECTYSDNDILFSATWTSADGNVTYDISGISLVSLVIWGWGDVSEISGNETDTDNIFFVGIMSGLFPD
jgi:hypothetical protein